MDGLIGEASGKGVLRELHRKYSPGHEAMIGPILQEIGRDKPIRSARATVVPEDDPLAAFRITAGARSLSPARCLEG